ncbi:YVTN repeat-like/Quino protein amine dehydrogenase [Sistotremastrum suecicum HHB10207 ss-3]|uniref:YVTN repeat-like/Quino protein amine dehydrogenase n=1 Tax=Sistotremastrum suecicum HHB10207 ss-3 TaxID=1314776 RepID=A0A166B0D0_9AGAM|nr:YVTN repeat-like/Quino protein amine dehydrogenase [Sistotremastrum suecicum HHB10207 ss-3]
MVRRDQRYNTVLSGSLSSFESPVFSPDGSILLYQPTRTTLAAWDIKERKEIWSYSHSDAIMASEVSPDGRLVASSAWDQTVQIRNIITGELIHTLVGAHGQNWAVKFSPDSSLVAGGSGDQTLRIWDVNSGKLIHAFDGFRGWIRSISFSDNLRYVSAGASGGHLRIFDIKEGKEVQRWEVDISGRWTRGFIETRGVRYLDADTVAFSTSDGTITVYDAKENVKWEIARRWDGASFPGGFVQTPDGKQIITLDADATVRVWELKRAA